MLCYWPFAFAFMLRVENMAILDYLILLAYLNSLINPCLYMSINRDVRASFKKFFSCNNKAGEEVTSQT